MGTMRERRVQRILDRRAADAEDVETIAHQREQEAQAVALPSSPADALAATYGEVRVDSVLHRLSERLVRFDETLGDILELEQRLNVYLERPGGEASRYTDLLCRAAGAGEPLDAREQANLLKIQGYLIGELNPLLFRIQQAVTQIVLENEAYAVDATWRSLAQPDGVWRALQVGRIGDQATASIFNLIQRVHEAQPGFPTFSPEAPNHPEGKAMSWMAEMDPLDAKSNLEYLRTVTEGSGRTIPDLIQRRSGVAVAELERAAGRVPGIDRILGKLAEPDAELTGEEQATVRQHQAYQVVAQWIEHHQAGLRPDMSTDELAALRPGLHFVHGSPEDVMNILNAAEVIKETDPLLFVRLLGVAPGRDYSARSAQRSDLFANVFHLAFHRSHQLARNSSLEGMVELRKRLDTLLDFSATLPDMLAISAEQMQAIEARMKTEAMAILDTADSGKSWLLLTGGFMSLMPGYKMQRDLEQVLAGVSLEERDRNLTRLTNAGPREFVQLVMDLAYSSPPSQDPEFMAIIKRRLGKLSAEIRETPQSVHNYIGIINGRRYIRDHRYPGMNLAPDLKFTLWETAPDEAVLSDEFYQDIEMTAANGTDQTNAYAHVWRAISAHPQIGREAWRWSAGSRRLTVQQETDALTGRQKKKRLAEYSSGQRLLLKDALRKMIGSLSAQELDQVDSKIFTILAADVQLTERPDDPTVAMVEPDIKALYGDRALVKSRSGHDHYAWCYRQMQKVYTGNQLVERYGRYVALYLFRKHLRDRTPTRSAMWIETLPEPDQVEVLHALFDEQFHSQLGWDQAVLFDKDDPFVDLSTLASNLKAHRIEYPQQEPQYQLVYSAHKRLTRLRDTDWRIQALYKAQKKIPNDPALQRMLAGERQVDPLIFQAAYGGGYEHALTATWHMVERLGYGAELAETLQRYHAPDITPDDFETAIIQLPPQIIFDLQNTYRAIVLRHIDEEFTTAEACPDQAEARYYANRLRSIKVLLNKDTTWGGLRNNYPEINRRAETVQQSLMDKLMRPETVWPDRYSPKENE